MSLRQLLRTIRPLQISQTVRNSLPGGRNQPTHFKPPHPTRRSSKLITSLIKSCFENGLIQEASSLFDEIPDRDVVAWTTMIAGYCSCNLHNCAWTVFCEMLREENLCADIRPNEFTFSSALKACKGMNSLSFGGLVHGLALKCGMKGLKYVENALLDLYATCCPSMDEACMVFQEMSEKNIVSWTMLIAGYTHRGDGHGGLNVFRQMLLDVAEPNPFTFSIAVKACALFGSYVCGQQIHASVIKYGCGHNTPVMNSILDMYCKCSNPNEAHECFNAMTARDVITWNTLIAGYEKSNPDISLHIYSVMVAEGVIPNYFTYTTILSAVANLAVLGCGEQIHGGILRRGLGGNLELANAIIDMYAKCGNIANSRKIFDDMSTKNLVTWTSMMLGYGSHGYGKEAVYLFDEMVKSSIKPDRVVFLTILGACSHAGLVLEGLRYFRSMTNDYDITPDHDIYGCLVDLLGRAGQVEEAYELIKGMPFPPDESILGALLGSCKAHKLPDLGGFSVEKLSDLSPDIAGTKLILSNIYAADGKWGEFAKLRRLMRRMGGKKDTGKSWVGVRNQIFSFVAGDKVGSHIGWTYGALDMLVQHMSEVGHVPDLDCMETNMTCDISLSAESRISLKVLHPSMKHGHFDASVKP